MMVLLNSSWNRVHDNALKVIVLLVEGIFSMVSYGRNEKAFLLVVWVLVTVIRFLGLYFQIRIPA